MHAMQKVSWFDSGVVILGLLMLIILAACVKTEVMVGCGPGGGPGGGPDGPGGTCSKHTVAPLTPLASNVVAIDPTNGTIPAGASCSSASGASQSYQCNSAVAGTSCNMTGGKCRDTYDIGTTVCDCQCR